MALVCVAVALAVPAWAQSRGGKFGSFGAGFDLDGGGPIVSVKADFTAPTKGQPARVFVTATMKPGWHIYSISQVVQDLGPKPTKIHLAESADYRLTGAFQANRPPVKKSRRSSTTSWWNPTRERLSGTRRWNFGRGSIWPA